MSFLYIRNDISGKIYCVDATNGNDSSPGTMAQPWQTITKVNATALNPGDQVLFKRGEIFAGSIVPNGAGTAGLPIVFGDYGSGALPIIDGNATSGGFYATLATQHHYTIQNIDFYRGTYGVGLLYYLHDVFVTGCTFRNATNCGISAWTDSNSKLVYNIFIANCIAHDNAQQGIFVGADVASNASPINCLVDHCTCYINGSNVEAHHGIYVRYQVEVRYCESYGNASAGIKVNDEANVNHLLYPIVHHNYVHDNKYGLQLNHNDARIYNNKSANNQANAHMSTGAPGAGIRFYHNTLVNANSTLRGMYFGDNTVTGMVIKNNLFVQDKLVGGVSPQTIRSGSGSAANLAANNVWNNNVHYVDGLAGSTIIYDGTNLTLAQWKTAGAGANEQHADPVFVTPYTNLHLQGSSPCIGAGDATVEILTDYDDVTRGAAVDIGAFEYVA